MFAMQRRDMSRVDLYASLDDAVASGLKNGKPFDVSVASGAVVWTWEQR